MKFGYIRTSKKEQNEFLQIDALKKYGVEEKNIFMEKVSGMKTDRKQLEEMLKYLREGDSVVVFKLDRIGRSTKHLIELVEYFEKNNIEFISVEDKIDTSTAMGKLFFRLMASLAEFERDLISERTKAGLAAARARGRFGGRPKKKKDKIETALKMYDSKDYSINEICEAAEISKATLYNYIDKRNKEKDKKE